MSVPIIKNRELRGVVRLTETATYFFNLPENGQGSQNTLANYNTEEVWIICDRGGEESITCDIWLPQIALFKGGWNGKIYVVNKDENVKINAFQNGINDDSINFVDFTSVGVKGIIMLHIVDNNLWGSWNVV